VRAADDDAGVRLLHHAGVEERLWMLVGGRAAVDLRGHDGVGDVEVLIARLRVEAQHVVAELRAAAVEELAPPREAGQDLTQRGRACVP
jgi:hypothetical protein